MTSRRQPGDRARALPRAITHRDFLAGVPLAAGGAVLARQARSEAGPYPPALTGLRVGEDGAFEVTNALRGAPPEIARRRPGRVEIADAGTAACSEVSIDQGQRAVSELVA
jgi:hypothetical protein